MPAGSTYEPIATTTLGSAASSITFSSIAASWTDLRLVFIAPTVSASGAARIRFNSDTGTNYSYTVLGGDGATATSTRATSDTQYKLGNLINTSTTVPQFYQVDIFSYAGSTNKTALTTFSNDQNGAGSTEQSVGLWRNTSAITSVFIWTGGTATFGIGTTATLYGIKNA